MYKYLTFGAVFLLGLTFCLNLLLKEFRGLLPPSHLSGHQIYYERNLISEELGSSLRELIFAIGETEGFHSNTQDLRHYSTKHEHIGEAAPIGPCKKCENPLMVPSINGTECIIPGRLDIGRHFILTGGLEGLRENYEHLVSRALSFGVYLFDIKKYSVVSTLFNQPSFIELAKKVCPAEKQFLDPFQFNFILQVPGQAVPSHLDGVYFEGATRFQVPQWLLAAMKFSGLFEKRFVDQVQVVAYLHEWLPSPERSGGFVYWDGSTEKGIEEDPWPLAGSAVDGSKTVHASHVYMPGSTPPDITKDKPGTLKYSKGKWELVVDGKVRNNYSTEDLRITIVYRARCFRDEFEAKSYSEKHFGERTQNLLELEEILETFAKDLVSRGKVISVERALQEMPRFELALLIMDTYIKYPYPTKSDVIVPWNYCALPRLMPWTRYILEYVCS